MSDAPRWQYKTVLPATCTDTGSSFVVEGTPVGNGITCLLDHFGREGWELVTVRFPDDVDGSADDVLVCSTYVFKRLVSQRTGVVFA